MEPLKWPIAPDGYIPNSVIRSWGVKEKVLDQSRDDIIFYSLRREQTAQDKAGLSTRIYWFDEDEDEDEDEEEMTYDAKRRRKEFVNEKRKKKEDTWGEKEDGKYPHGDVGGGEESVVGGKERTDEKKEEKINGSELLKQSYSIQRKTEISDHGAMKPQSSTLRHETGTKGLTEVGEETITPPFLSVSIKQRTSAFIPQERPEPLVERPVVSADTLTTSRATERRIIDHTTLIEPQTSALPVPEDLQPQLDLSLTERPPVRSEISLLSMDKYDNITEQAAMPLDPKVWKLYKKYKYNIRNLSQHGKHYTPTEHPLSSKAAQFTFQTITRGLRLNTGLSSRHALRTTLSSIQTQPQKIIKTKCPSHSLCSDHPAQFEQSIYPPRDQKDQKPMSKWRKSLYALISLQGFRSLRASLVAAEHAVQPSNARQVVTSIPPVQPDQVSVHHRVVQNIKVKDTLEVTSTCFHHVIPMAAQHGFFTLDHSGRTQYGRLQFDWIRGHEEDKLLKVSAVKIKDKAYKAL